MLAVYTIVRGGRCDLTSKSIKMLRTWAGCKFDHYVAVNNADAATVALLKDKEAKGYFKLIQYHSKNYGQNIAANWLLDEMGDEYDWVLRWDDDAIPRTRRFLRKLVAGAELAKGRGCEAIWSPEILKLENPPEPLMEAGDDLGFRYEPVEVLGGICRLHPARVFDNWRFNRFGALGFGEAVEMTEHSRRLGMIKLRNLDIKVEHAYGHSGQKARFPEIHTWEFRESSRLLGYGL